MMNLIQKKKNFQCFTNENQVKFTKKSVSHDETSKYQVHILDYGIRIWHMPTGRKADCVK